MANYIIEDINPNLSKVLSNKEDSIQNSFSKKPMIVMWIKEANRLLNIESIQTPNKVIELKAKASYYFCKCL